MDKKDVMGDLQRFIARFEPRKFKETERGIEVRGMVDIHQGIARATEVIDKLKLNLKVVHTADMAGYGAFEVNKG